MLSENDQLRLISEHSESVPGMRLPGMAGPMGPFNLMGPTGPDMVPSDYMDPRGEPTISYVHEEGYPVEGPGPNIGRIENPPEPTTGAYRAPWESGSPTEQEARGQFQEWENAVKTATPQEHLSKGLHAGPGGLPSVSMANTLAQNIEANKAQQQSTAGILEAGRARLPGNTGGRMGYALGNLDAGAQSIVYGGLPGIPQMAPDGMEYDMSQNGGFQALGAQEGKDDIKANLAKNEFVFTAAAVRGAGDGDVEIGAQRMYDTMKRLEGRVA